jgi:hypothetical protein
MDRLHNPGAGLASAHPSSAAEGSKMSIARFPRAQQSKRCPNLWHNR